MNAVTISKDVLTAVTATLAAIAKVGVSGGHFTVADWITIAEAAATAVLPMLAEAPKP